jgi:hypothetical protein
MVWLMLTWVLVTGDAICTMGAIDNGRVLGDALSMGTVGGTTVIAAEVGNATTGGVFGIGVGMGVFFGGSVVVNWSHAAIVNASPTSVRDVKKSVRFIIADIITQNDERTKPVSPPLARKRVSISTSF